MNSERRQLAAKAYWIVFLVASLAVNAAEQQHPNSSLFEGQPAKSLFQSGRYEASINNGVLFSPFVATRNRPSIDYTITELQFGYMLSDIKETAWFRGNFEVLFDGFGSGVFRGTGSYVAGLTVWGRYNFVPENCRWTPFAQAGAGLVLTDVDRRVVGQDFNFNLDLGVGVRYLVNSRWSLNLEYRYQHISNADLGHRNLGVNAHGPVFGVSYFF